MSEHVGYVIQIKELNEHPNADKLQIATIFGASVIVDLSVKINDIGIYFPIDLQLSEEYCNQNNLTRKLDSEGNNIGGYLDPNKRNIRAIKLRGERSEGLFMPLDSLFYTGITSFEIGNKIDILNKHEICKNIYLIMVIYLRPQLKREIKLEKRELLSHLYLLNTQILSSSHIILINFAPEI